MVEVAMLKCVTIINILLLALGTDAFDEKDLGPDTEEIAEKMTSFDPNASWKKTEITEPGN